MVDREARDKYADLIEAFLRGEISNRQYDDAASRLRTESEDEVIEEAYRFLWGAYCDIAKQHVHDLQPEAQTAFRRGAVFLRSERDLAWPPDAPWGTRCEGCAVVCVYGFLLLAGLCLLLWALASLCWLPVILGAPLMVVTWVFVRWRRRRRREAKEKLREIGDVDAFPFLTLAEYDEEAARQAAERDSG